MTASKLGMAALAAAACIQACGSDDEELGTLIVPYQIGNNRACDAASVDEVRAELDEGAIAETVDCEEGEVRFSQLSAGRYEVIVYGLDEEGLSIVDSLADGPVEVDVRSDGTTVVDPPVELTAAPVTLLLRWDLGFGNCESAEIDRFDVTAWRQDGAARLLSAELACTAAGRGEGSYRQVPDPDRDLRGFELGEVEVQPVATDGADLGPPAVFVFEPPGAGREVRLSLVCDEEGCTGTGEPDES